MPTAITHLTRRVVPEASPADLKPAALFRTLGSRSVPTSVWSQAVEKDSGEAIRLQVRPPT
jgi:hypothetical protein